jgi:NAD(P)-dependent dehydrogenase (short-subunit alcohol dehydrogenase family)
MAKLKGKIALIAGGACDINLLVAKEFIKEGAHVFIMRRHEADLAVALEQVGSNVTGVQGDASKIGDLDRLFAQIEREKGRVDIVFANADAAEVAMAGHTTEEHYYSFFVSVKNMFFLVQKALPLMPNGSSIVLNAPVLGNKGGSENWTNSATISAVFSFARTWARELRNRHIRVNAAPLGSLATTDQIAKAVLFLASEGSVVTGEESVMAQNISPNQIPFGRLGTLEEIAEAVLFLASDDNDLTGMELIVDTGFPQA